MNNIRKAAEQSLEQVRERYDAFLHWFKLNTGFKSQEFKDLESSMAVIDTLLDVIDAYEAEHEVSDLRNMYTLSAAEIEAAKATAIARMKGWTIKI